MKPLLSLLLFAGLARAAAAFPVPLTLDTNASTFEFELCVLGTCDTQTRNLRGTATVALDSDPPGQIAVQNFDVDATSDFVFRLSYGLLGRIDATVAGMRVYHADPGPAQPFVPVTNGTFVVTNVPFLTSGQGTYTASGGICGLLQINNQPCSTNFDLATLGTSTAEAIAGTVQVSNDTVYVSLAFSFSGPLDPANPTLATIRGVANIHASGPLASPLVPAGSAWRYLDDGSNPGGLWRTLGYSDSHWSTGPAQLGYGDGDEATVLNRGPTNAPHITTYFRHAFNVPDASVYTNLWLRLIRDDGAIVSLNNVEVFRSNLPTGTVTAATLAASTVGGAAETTWFGAWLNPAHLRTGNNVLAVEVHQVAPTSSDLSFDLELAGNTAITNAAPTVAITAPADGARVAGGTIAVTAVADDPDGLIALVEFFAGPAKIGEAWTAPFAILWTNAVAGPFLLTARATDNFSQTVTSVPVALTVIRPPLTLLSVGSTWKYLDTAADQGVLWRDLGFNDSAWPSGAAQLGFGDGDETTLIASNGQTTTYFRRSFAVYDAALCTNLAVRLLRDDGGVVYLNGTEVFRSNLPTNEPIFYTTFASAAASAEEETTFFHEATIPAALLLEGNNLVAVEIHQATPDSSDLSFDLELLGWFDVGPPALRSAWQGGQFQLAWPAWASGFALHSATNLTPPVVWVPEPAAVNVSDGLATAVPATGERMKFFRLVGP